MIFTDKRVFQLSYVPDHIVHRDEVISRIRSILSDFTHGVRPRNMLVIGDFGTGKTAVVRYICRSLPANVVPVYVNCAESNTQVRVFRRVLESLGVAAKTGFPGDYYLNLFKKSVASLPGLVLVLDEVDRLIDHEDSEYEDLFYTLSRSEELNKLVAILLTNRFSLEVFLLGNLDGRVKDTFRWERVEFPDYFASELGDILSARAQVGFRQNACDSAIVAMISRMAYEKGLRARGVIDLALKAGEIAEAKQHEAISEEDVRVAAVELRHGQDMQSITRLPPILRTILANVLLNSPTAKDGYKWFRESSLGSGLSSQAYYGYLTELETLGLLEKRKVGLGRGKGVMMRLAVPTELTTLIADSLTPTASAVNVTHYETTYPYNNQEEKKEAP